MWKSRLRQAAFLRCGLSPISRRSSRSQAIEANQNIASMTTRDMSSSPMPQLLSRRTWERSCPKC